MSNGFDIEVSGQACRHAGIGFNEDGGGRGLFLEPCRVVSQLQSRIGFKARICSSSTVGKKSHLPKLAVYRSSA